MLELRNGWYYDANNNRWDADIETLESATIKSKSLINCKNCTDCTDCSWCSGCSDCSGCTDCSWCSGCTDCSGCSGCSDCSGCTDCSWCKDFKENPQRYVTPKIGSRNAQTTLYWLKDNIQVVCGCYRGNLVQFEEKVKEVHAETEHLKPYLKQIKIMKYLIKMNK